MNKKKKSVQILHLWRPEWNMWFRRGSQTVKIILPGIKYVFYYPLTHLETIKNFMLIVINIIG